MRMHENILFIVLPDIPVALKTSGIQFQARNSAVPL